MVGADVAGACVTGACVAGGIVGADVAGMVHRTINVRGKLGSGDGVITCPTVCDDVYLTHALPLYHTAAAHAVVPADTHTSIQSCTEYAMV